MDKVIKSMCYRHYCLELQVRNDGRSESDKSTSTRHSGFRAGISPLSNNHNDEGTYTNAEVIKRQHIRVQCPAKINLTLKVTGKRDDGYHNIDSIMQTISLYDYLTISVERSDMPEISLSGTSSEIPYNEKNLAWKAAELFLKRANIRGYAVNCHIEKNIPVAAGLAGGSTDAAGMLYGLNKLFGGCLNSGELHELCAELGSDLNLCLEGGRQRTSGRGEILEPLPFEEFKVSLIKPSDLGISAKEAYTRFSEKIGNSAREGSLNSAPFEGKEASVRCGHTNAGAGSNLSREGFVNDLEWAVADDYKVLQKIKNLYPAAVMSGSGPVFFAVNTEFEPQAGFWVKNNLKSVPFGVKEV